MFLANDKYGYIAWHRAAQNGNLRSLEAILSWWNEGIIKHTLMVASPDWGWKYCLPVGSREQPCRNTKGTEVLGWRSATQSKWVIEEFVTSQRQLWVYCVTPCCKFWQIRAFVTFFWITDSELKQDKLLFAQFTLSQDFFCL